MQRRINPRRNTEANLDGQCRQGQRKGGWNAFSDQHNRITPIAHGPAQIALQNRPEIGEILNPNRFIQAPGGTKGINRFRGRIRAHDDLCRITGKAQHNESEGDHHGNGERSARQA